MSTDTEKTDYELEWTKLRLDWIGVGSTVYGGVV